MAITTPTASTGSLTIDGMDTLLADAIQLGAIEGAKRIEFVCSQYKQLTPQGAYLWINPTAIQDEIEEASLHRWWIQVVHVLRNIFSLAPLIATWTALFIAVNAYQRDLSKNPTDNTIPFLQLWQNGFNGATGFTFTLAAGLDVLLLLGYLIWILVLHELERRAHTHAVNFINSETWRKPVGKLMEAIEAASKPFIADKSDIQNVVDAITAVVERSKDYVKQMADSAVDTNQKLLSTTEQSIQSFVSNARQSFDQVTTASQKALTQVASSSEQAVNQIAASSEQVVNQAFGLAAQSITDMNKRVETLFEMQVKPLIEAFQHDLSALQGELHNYQGRLDKLTDASETLASMSLALGKASKTLEENAAAYLTIGQDIKTQLTALKDIQADVLSQIRTVSGSISTAAGSMGTATGNMVAAAQEVNGLAWQLNSATQATIDTMTTSVDNAAKSLTDAGSAMQDVASQLQTTVRVLASIRPLFPIFRRRPGQPQGRVS